MVSLWFIQLDDKIWHNYIDNDSWRQKIYGQEYPDLTSMDSITHSSWDFSALTGRNSTNRKIHSLFRIDVSEDINNWVDFGMPFYYIARFIYSKIGNDRSYAYLDYNYSDHFLALGLRSYFYIIGYIANETQIVDPGGVYDDPILSEEKSYGLGFDWFFKDGIAIYFKSKYFKHFNYQDDFFNFSGYDFGLNFQIAI